MARAHSTGASALRAAVATVFGLTKKKSQFSSVLWPFFIKDKKVHTVYTEPKVRDS